MALTRFFQNVVTYVSASKRRRKLVRTREVFPSTLDIPIFVINLERNLQRRAFSLQRLADLGLKGEVFPAVEGKMLDVKELEKTGIYNDALAHEKFSRSLSMAEIGCSLSHLRLYQKLLDENIDVAIVLEDDAMFIDGAGERLLTLLEGLPEDWDLVQLIYECEDYSIAAAGVVKFLSKSCMPVASAGYFIRRSGARKLLEEGYPIRYPADSFIGRSPRWGTNVYGAQHRLVKINNIFPSEIYQGRTLKSKLGNTVKAAFVRLLG